MAKTIIVGGYGPGISAAVAEKFGGAGYSVALVSRSADKLNAGVEALKQKGIKAAAFPTDLADENAVKALIGKVREALGPITAIHWNAYGGGAGNLLTADVAEVKNQLDVAIVSLLTAIKTALPDLKKEKGGVLVTNSGLCMYDAKMDSMAVQYGMMGLSIANAAKHKMVAMLAEQLKADGVYVGEVVVTGTVKGTAFDTGSGNLEPSKIAERFLAMYQARSEASTTFAG